MSISSSWVRGGGYISGFYPARESAHFFTFKERIFYHPRVMYIMYIHRGRKNFLRGINLLTNGHLIYTFDEKRKLLKNSIILFFCFRMNLYNSHDTLIIQVATVQVVCVESTTTFFLFKFPTSSRRVCQKRKLARVFFFFHQHVVVSR